MIWCNLYALLWPCSLPSSVKANLLHFEQSFKINTWCNAEGAHPPTRAAVAMFTAQQHVLAAAAHIHELIQDIEHGCTRAASNRSTAGSFAPSPTSTRASSPASSTAAAAAVYDDDDDGLPTKHSTAQQLGHHPTGQDSVLASDGFASAALPPHHAPQHAVHTNDTFAPQHLQPGPELSFGGGAGMGLGHPEDAVAQSPQQGGSGGGGAGRPFPHVYSNDTFDGEESTEDSAILSRITVECGSSGYYEGEG
eukprot:1137225-Pelagomonas_calceolata.AAC.2